MLTIQNYGKLYRKDIGAWRISRVEEVNDAYLIQLVQFNGMKLQVNLERNGINTTSNKEYELWCWNDVSKGGWANQSAIPIRMMLKLKTIKDINNLIHSIELLVRDIK